MAERDAEMQARLQERMGREGDECALLLQHSTHTASFS